MRFFSSSRYEVVQEQGKPVELGEGGMAVVYLGKDLLQGTQVAIKVLKPHLLSHVQIRNKFLKEGRSLFQMSHPNVVRVYNLIDQPDCAALVMEYIEGETLRQKIARQGRFSDEEVKLHLEQLLQALQYVHDQKIIHRDIKSGNIMLDKQGQIKLLDFGIAKSINPNDTDSTAMGLMSPLWASPEQLNGERLSISTDIYSSGVVLWEMASGQRPWNLTNPSLGTLVEYVNNRSLPELSCPWDRQIQIATAKRPSGRYSSAQKWLEELHGMKYLDATTEVVVDETTILTTKGPPRRKYLTLYLGMTSIVVALFSVFFYTQRSYLLDFWNGVPHKIDVDSTVVDATKQVDTIHSEVVIARPSIEWVNIQGGSFTMGSPDGEMDRSSDEGPQHQVHLTAFKMSKYEITFEQYDAFCEATGRRKPSDYGWGRGNRPVIDVDWNDATAFAEWMGCRLPTEAQWEYACRSGTETPFNVGSCLSTSQANCDGNNPYLECPNGTYLERTIEVGSFSPNSWGLYDMHGNVWEWCSDWYVGFYSSQEEINPIGPGHASNKVMRGGSWKGYSGNCRSAHRAQPQPSVRDNDIGFRLVCSD